MAQNKEDHFISSPAD